MRNCISGTSASGPPTPLNLSPIYNLCPMQHSPVLRLVAGRQFDHGTHVHYEAIDAYNQMNTIDFGKRSGVQIFCPVFGLRQS